MKTTQELISFNQANVAAFVKSGQIFAAGMQDMGKMFATSAQTSFNEAVSTFRALTTVRSVKEAIDLQAGFARSSMEKAMSEGSKVAESSIKLAGEAFAPITDRMNTAVAAFKPA